MERFKYTKLIHLTGTGAGYTNDAAFVALRLNF